MLKKEDEVKEKKSCVVCGELAEDEYKLERHLIIKAVVVIVKINIKKYDGEGHICKKCLKKEIHKNFLEEVQ